MTEKELEEREEKTHEEKMEEVRERMEQMYGGSGPRDMPRGMGGAPLLSRMASMQGGQQGGLQSKVVLNAFRELQGDVEEIKGYLEEILTVLKKQEE